MRTFDFAPLYRSTVGFDRLFSGLDQAETSAAWPPYDIEKLSEDAYRITMAVAGFAQDEIDLTQHDTTLLVVGQKKGQEREREYLHRGIAGRTFRQSFNLALALTQNTIEGMAINRMIHGCDDAMIDHIVRLVEAKAAEIEAESALAETLDAAE